MIDHLRTILISAIVIPIFICFALILIILSFFAKPIIYFLAQPLCRIVLLLLGIRLRISGTFPENGPYIIMANHSSFIDIFLIPAIIKGRFTAIAAKFNYKYPVYAQLLKSFRIIPIDRYNRNNSFNGIKRAEEVINKHNYHVVILPEGTRTETGKMNPLKKGGFHMALNTGTPILPVGIEGAYDYKPQNRNTFKPGRVHIQIGEPIDPMTYEKSGLDGIMKIVDEKLKKLSGEF